MHVLGVGGGGVGGGGVGGCEGPVKVSYDDVLHFLACPPGFTIFYGFAS